MHSNYRGIDCFGQFHASFTATSSRQRHEFFLMDLFLVCFVPVDVICEGGGNQTNNNHSFCMRMNHSSLNILISYPIKQGFCLVCSESYSSDHTPVYNYFIYIVYSHQLTNRKYNRLSGVDSPRQLTCKNSWGAAIKLSRTCC